MNGSGRKACDENTFRSTYNETRRLCDRSLFHVSISSGQPPFVEGFEDPFAPSLEP